MKRVFCLIICYFFALINIVLAESDQCTNEEKVRLRELAGSTQITYKIKEFEGDNIPPFMAFEVTITGFRNEFYIATDYGVYLKTDNAKAVVEYPFSPGEAYQLSFYGTEKSLCEDELILIKSISFPPYNYYAKDPLCVGYEDCEFCQEYSAVKFQTYNEFKQKMENYIAELNKKEPLPKTEVPIEQKSNIITNMINFFLQYHLYFLIPIILMGTTGIIIIELKKRRSIL